MLRLGELYLEGKEIEKDLPAAFKWNKMAADAGHREGMYRLGLAYEKGLGVIPNKQKCMYWYERGIKFGSDKSYKRIKSMNLKKNN